MMLGPHYDRFVACCDCGILVPAVSEARTGNGYDPDDGTAVDGFTTEHCSHDLIELRRTDTDPVSEGALWDPMVRVHIELTDGDRLFIATASRSSIEEDRFYTFRPCGMRTLPAEVDVAEIDVRRGLDLEFFPHAIRPAKVDDFLDALHEAIRDLAAEDLEIAFVDADDPQVAIAPMPEQAVQRVLVASSKIFDPWEFPLVERFLQENRQETGVLALRVRRNAIAADD